MIVVYTPKGGEPEQYDASSLLVSEAAIVQRTIDMKWQEIVQGLERDDLDAMRGIVWIIKKRGQPTLRFGDFDPGVNDMVTRMDNEEVAAWIDRAFAATENDPDMTPDMFASILQKQLPDVAADPDHARALIAKKAAAPKEDQAEEASQPAETAEAPSPSPTSSTPETSTSDSSLTSSTSHRETLTA